MEVVELVSNHSSLIEFYALLEQKLVAWKYNEEVFKSQLEFREREVTASLIRKKTPAPAREN
jgi:hypothetical protein